MARSPKQAAKAPLTYNGVNLTAPSPVNVPSFSLDPNSIASAVQSSQNQANQANQARYNQGLGVLTGGANSAQGYISQALANSNKIGQAARTRVGQNLQNAQGSTTQSAVSRGIGNTTILDALQRGNSKDAENANQQIDEQIADRASNLNLQQANQSNQGANSIAGFIAARNDNGPDLSTYANLARAAAGSTQGAKASGTTINAPPSYGTFGGGSSGVTSSTGGSTGGGAGTYFNNAAGGGSGGIGGNAGTYSGTQGSGPIASSISTPSTTPVSNGVPFSNNAGTNTITELPDATPSPAPASVGNTSMSMTKPGAPQQDIYKFFGLLPGSMLTDDMYRKYNAAMGTAK